MTVVEQQSLVAFLLVIPAQAEVLYNSKAGQSSDFKFVITAQAGSPLNCRAGTQVAGFPPARE